MKYSDFTDGKCFFSLGKLALKCIPKRKSCLVKIFADIYIYFSLKFQVSVFIEMIDILGKFQRNRWRRSVERFKIQL